MSKQRVEGDSEKRPITAKIFLIPVCALLLSQFFSFFVSSYYGIKLSESLIFMAADGWCDTKSQGVGVHCFGDFSAFMQFDTAEPWKNSTTAYPPLSIIFFSFFKFIYGITNGSNTSLFLYQLLLVLSTISPSFYYFFRKDSRRGSSMIIAAASLLFAPALMVIDRGNNIGFAVPLIFLAYIFALEKRYKAFQLVTVLLALWKPQFGLLCLFLLMANKKKFFFQYIAITISSYVVIFSFFGLKDTLSNVKYWLINLFKYQSYVDLPTVFPANISFANIFALPLYLFSKFELFASLKVEKILNHPKFYSIVSVTSLLVCLVILYLNNRSLNEVQKITSLLILVIMTPTVSFAYYLVVLTPFFYLLIHSLCADEISPSSTTRVQSKDIVEQFTTFLNRKWQQIIFYFFIITCFINWPLTWRFFGLEDSNPASYLSIVWLVSPVFLLLFLLLIMTSGRDGVRRIKPNSLVRKKLPKS